MYSIRVSKDNMIKLELTARLGKTLVKTLFSSCVMCMHSYFETIQYSGRKLLKINYGN